MAKKKKKKIDKSAYKTKLKSTRTLKTSGNKGRAKKKKGK